MILAHYHNVVKQRMMITRAIQFSVIPANAGIHVCLYSWWIPAFAGMTNARRRFQQPFSCKAEWLCDDYNDKRIELLAVLCYNLAREVTRLRRAFCRVSVLLWFYFLKFEVHCEIYIWSSPFAQVGYVAGSGYDSV